jgi:virginiamycin B lyase
MNRLNAWRVILLFLAVAALSALFHDIPASVSAQGGSPLLGGARGVVRSARGDLLEGVGVQLISSTTAIRTTVYTDAEGQYEFPKLANGSYTLRISRPLEFRPYQKDSVRISGADQLEPIVLEKLAPESDLVPATPEVLAQISGVEWLQNLTGTGQEKRAFSLACGNGCHSYQQIFKNRYDEQSWRLIVQRMLRGSGSPLINQARITPERRGRTRMPSVEEEELVAKWLAKARGPESVDAPVSLMPRPRGRATRVIVTEYELPRTILAPHDVHGDSQGRIWYTAHRSSYFGMLDPATGKVTEYHPPDIPGVLPGTHRIWVDERDIVWVSENWSHNLVQLDPKTGEFKRFHYENAGPMNGPGFSNFAMDAKGFVYETLDNGVVKIDRNNGRIVRHYPLPKVRGTYDNVISYDGKYWSGGTNGRDLLGLLDLESGQLWELETPTYTSSPARGAFDRDGNAWFGGRGGMVLKLDSRTRKITEYWPPIPYATFYEVMPDKNGEIWGAPLQTGRFIRFNPRTEVWVDYMLPELYSHDRRTWIDNSTNPVTVWYVDHNGIMTRIQPLD